MTEIYNYKLKEFLNQEKDVIIEYINVFKYLKPIPTENDIYYLRLKDVDFIKTNIGSGDNDAIIKIISMVQGIKKKEVYELEILEFFGLVNSVKEQIKVIVDNEINHLSDSIPNLKWEAVRGSERLQKFGIYNTLDNLSGGDILKYKSIMKLNYADVFVKLLMDKTKNELNNEMSKTKTK